MAKVFIHIGLPKTATSSLQKKFRDLKEASFKFYGVHQPRSESQSEDFKLFYKYIITGKGKEEVIDAFSRDINNGLKILISEEMILVSRESISWRKKLMRLSDLIKSFDYQIIVTIREPAKAMFSYYVERLDYFKGLEKEFNNDAIMDESMQIYHYNTFFNFLYDLFKKEKIFVKKFESIILNDLNDIWEILELDYDKNRNRIENINTKEKKEGYIIKDTSILFSKFLLKKLPKTLTSSLIVKKIFNKLFNFPIKLKHKIEIPSESEFAEIRNKLKNETKFMEDEYNINY